MARQRISSARDVLIKLIDDHHHDRIHGEDLDIILGQVRNQLTIVLDSLSGVIYSIDKKVDK